MYITRWCCCGWLADNDSCSTLMKDDLLVDLPLQVFTRRQYTVNSMSQAFIAEIATTGPERAVISVVRAAATTTSSSAIFNYKDQVKGEVY